MTIRRRLIPLTIGTATFLAVFYIYNLYRKKQDCKGHKTKDGDFVLKTLIDPNEKYFLPLIEKEEITHDTRRFRFGLPSSKHVLGLPVGQHVYVSATIDDELVIRAYTPVSSDDDFGHLDLVIKVYFKNVNPKFPDGGKLSQYLNNMKIGDTIAFRGPNGKIQYLGNGKFQIKKLRKDPAEYINSNQVNMIAGGTGITPMYQLIKAVLKNPEDPTKLALLYANQSEADILLHKELKELTQLHSNRFKIWYTVDSAPKDWAFSVGFINEEMISNHLYPPSDDTVNLLCGPPPMINYACQPNLEKLGHRADRRFAY